MMHLDDLDGLEEAGSLRGEPHHQHGADREVRHDENADRGIIVQQRAHLVQSLLGESRGADHDVNAMVDAPCDVIHDDTGMGEVDRHIAAEQGLQRVTLADLGGQLEILRRTNRRAGKASPSCRLAPMTPDR